MLKGAPVQQSMETPLIPRLPTYSHYMAAKAWDKVSFTACLYYCCVDRNCSVGDKTEADYKKATRISDYCNPCGDSTDFEVDGTGERIGSDPRQDEFTQKSTPCEFLACCFDCIVRPIACVTCYGVGSIIDCGKSATQKTDAESKVTPTAAAQPPKP